MTMELKFGGKRPSRARVAREQRTQLLEQLRRDAERVAARFGLRYRAIEAENGHVKRRYGSCHSDGVIKIRLTHVTTGRPLKYSSMVATLCHEIAHLKHFHHGPRFRDFNDVILDWARGQGIYRPEPQRRRAKPAATLDATGTLSPAVVASAVSASDASRRKTQAGPGERRLAPPAPQRPREPRPPLPPRAAPVAPEQMSLL